MIVANLPDIYEIGSVKVTDGEHPKIRFGETTMFFSGSRYRLPYFVNDTAYAVGLDSVLKFDNYEKGMFSRIKKYFRDEIGVNVDVGDNTVFRKDGKSVVIEWMGEKCPCETGNKSTLKPDEYEKLKELAKTLCAKNL